MIRRDLVSIHLTISSQDNLNNYQPGKVGLATWSIIHLI